MSRERILVVDDEEDLLELVKYNLSKEGYRVTGVGTGEAGLAEARRNPPDLIVLDLLLAGSRLPMERALPPGDYFALVARAERRPDCDVFAWTVRDPLPTIPIPLLAPDPEIVVDLAPIGCAK